MNELRSVAKERNLRGYSRLRKADLINFLRENEPTNEPTNESPNSSGDEMKQPIEQPLNGAITSTLTK